MPRLTTSCFGIVTKALSLQERTIAPASSAGAVIVAIFPALTISHIGRISSNKPPGT